MGDLYLVSQSMKSILLFALELIFCYVFNITFVRALVNISGRLCFGQLFLVQHQVHNLFTFQNLACVEKTQFQVESFRTVVAGLITESELGSV